MKIDIIGEIFYSKKAVIKYIQENILSRYDDFQSLSTAHFEFMVGLLYYHPWAEQKIGVGIGKIWIQKNIEYPTRGFWLERLDGTKTDFSFYQCLNNPSSLQDFKMACRRAIAPIVIQFRQKTFQNNSELVCPVLNIPMSIHSSHVDHEPPDTFDKIVNDFIEMEGIDHRKVELVQHIDGTIGNYFKNKKLEEKWITFHNDRAKLRVISIKANLSNGKNH